MLLGDSISLIKGIGRVSEGKLNEIGIFTVGDMLLHFPYEYRDMSFAVNIADIAEGELTLIKAKIERVSALYWRGVNRNVFRLCVDDGSAKLSVSFFNQSYLHERFNKGDIIRLYGRAKKESKGLIMVNPKLIGDEEAGVILPVYKLPLGIKQKIFRQAVSTALSNTDILDDIPIDVLEKYGILSYRDLLTSLHMPKNIADKNIALEQASIREMMSYELSLRMLRNKEALPLEFNKTIFADYISCLSYEPTNAQLRAMMDIAKDMSYKKAMNRLLQGDVGSGKTCVAFFAAYLAMENDAQSCFMAPTEILAAQHYENAVKIFGDRCALLTARTSLAKRREIKAGVGSGKISLVIGTHALLYSNMEYNKLVLVITDEQHRFGVAQRAALGKGENTHTLIMSATPIPRTLSLILYGEAGVSVLDALPAGRKEVKTYIVGLKRRADMYRWIKGELDKGEQGYIVCPLIEPSDEIDCVSVSEVYLQLKSLGFNAALLHGKMKSKEKNMVMDEFRRGKISILVSTTVIEVGVDVKNASIIVIENAERFGLAELHQLRGRVGRGEKPASCFLVSDKNSDRLSILKNCSDGFKISEEDLKLRGAGEFLGMSQSGFSSLPMDKRIITIARNILDDIYLNNSEIYAKLYKKTADNAGNNKNIVLN